MCQYSLVLRLRRSIYININGKVGREVKRASPKFFLFLFA